MAKRTMLGSGKEHVITTAAHNALFGKRTSTPTARAPDRSQRKNASVPSADRQTDQRGRNECGCNRLSQQKARDCAPPKMNRARPRLSLPPSHAAQAGSRVPRERR